MTPNEILPDAEKRSRSGRGRIRYAHIAAFWIACIVACGIIPAAGFWLVLKDAGLVRTAIAVGFFVACIATGATFSQSLHRKS